MNALAAPAAGLPASACKAAGRDVWIGNRFATTFCGPATAAVKLGGRKVTFSKGTCIWTTNSFTLQLGTIFHTFLAEDEVCLHLFEAPSAEAAGEASRRAAIAYERIVEAVE